MTTLLTLVAVIATATLAYGWPAGAFVAVGAAVVFVGMAADRIDAETADIEPCGVGGRIEK